MSAIVDALLAVSEKGSDMVKEAEKPSKKLGPISPGMDREDVLAVEDCIAKLLTQIEDSLAMATKDDWKQKYIEEIEDWVMVRDLLEARGYEKGGER